MDGAYSEQHREKIQRFIEESSKSYGVALIYALVYGPFGCFYTHNPTAAAVAIFAAVALGFVHWSLIGLVWVVCVVLAPFHVRAYNARIRRRARFLVV